MPQTVVNVDATNAGTTTPQKYGTSSPVSTGTGDHLRRVYQYSIF